MSHEAAFEALQNLMSNPAEGRIAYPRPNLDKPELLTNYALLEELDRLNTSIGSTFPGVATMIPTRDLLCMELSRRVTLMIPYLVDLETDPKTKMWHRVVSELQELNLSKPGCALTFKARQVLWAWRNGHHDFSTFI